MKKYGLIGKSLEHSFSKSFFEGYFEKNNISGTYRNIELQTIEDFVGIRDSFDGFNVTIPYKQTIIPFLDELTDEANFIGAVNVVQCVDGRLMGHNSDVFGFHQSIKPFLTNKHERALILGTGGASKAVEFVLKQIGLDVIFISRSPSGENEFSYEDINEHMLRACKIVVNTTPVGTFPNVGDCVSFPFEFLTQEHLVVDLIYNPVKTMFLQSAEENNATIMNGETMLKQQALKSYQIWTAE
ncbi:MAG: shikimate dehydrogenase [Crocinitomicaceae bacterium]|nr:shikimate dehydrogenase [Crocinitomicaceae bacterium]